MMRTHPGMRAAGLLPGLLAAIIAAAPLQASEVRLPVPSVTIYPGDTIGEEQLAERAFIAATVQRATVFDARDAITGKVAKRTLLPGQPIPLAAVRDAYVVVQGKTTVAVFEAGPLTITLQATALQNGSVGDLVSLRNNDSGATIKGTVAADGTVRLGAP
jgi:flagellar basal body P-ring formation protein FlgA